MYDGENWVRPQNGRILEGRNLSNTKELQQAPIKPHVLAYTGFQEHAWKYDNRASWTFLHIDTNFTIRGCKSQTHIITLPSDSCSGKKVNVMIFKFAKFFKKFCLWNDLKIKMGGLKLRVIWI